MTAAPTFDEIFAVIAAASVGDSSARIPVPDEPRLDDTATRLALAVNILLDDLAYRAAEGQQIALRQQEEIRRAYADALDAVTGGRLILLTQDELDASLGLRVCGPVAFSEAGELAGMRHRISTVIAGLERHVPQPDDFILAVSEATTNALKHADGGAWELRVTRFGLQAVVVDHGQGIDFRYLAKATLVPGFSTAQSLGMGFTIMLQTCERVLVHTQRGETRVVLEDDFVGVNRDESEYWGPVEMSIPQCGDTQPSGVPAPLARSLGRTGTHDRGGTDGVRAVVRGRIERGRAGRRREERLARRADARVARRGRARAGRLRHDRGSVLGVRG